jgi:hypothetical protein
MALEVATPEDARSGAHGEIDFASFNLHPDRYVTRRGIVEIADRLGIPISHSKLNKLAMEGHGPPVDGIIGNKHLSTTRTVVGWLLGQLKRPTG